MLFRTMSSDFSDVYDKVNSLEKFYLPCSENRIKINSTV